MWHRRSTLLRPPVGNPMYYRSSDETSDTIGDVLSSPSFFVVGELTGGRGGVEGGSEMTTLLALSCNPLGSPFGTSMYGCREESKGIV